MMKLACLLSILFACTVNGGWWDNGVTSKSGQHRRSKTWNTHSVACQDVHKIKRMLQLSPVSSSLGHISIAE